MRMALLLHWSLLSDPKKLRLNKQRFSANRGLPGAICADILRSNTKY
jgi:hypothetical protein